MFLPTISLFLTQALGMLIDEFYFHQRRGLSRWERLGHPMDTATALACFGYLALTPTGEANSKLYFGMAIASCLFVTKDEWVHRRDCSTGEMWLHSVLFMIHPVVLYLAYVCAGDEALRPLLMGLLLMASLFGVFQLVYWNVFAGPEKVSDTKVNNSIYNELGDRWYTAMDDPVAILRAECRTKLPWVQKQLQQHLPMVPQPKVLDVACGAGFLTNALAENNPNVTGIDLSSESLRVAAKYDSTQTVSYQTADATQLPFPDASFDVVTCMDFLEHVPNPETVVREASRVLKPGGLFLFHTFNRNRVAHLVVIKLLEWFVKNTPKNLHVYELFVTPEEAKGYCEKAQLECLEWTGLKPKWSQLQPWVFLQGRVPESFAFELTPSLLISYMGMARKKG